MKLTDLHIQNIGGIRDLYLHDLNDSMNVITGTNGVGKTTILKSIAAIFAGAVGSTLKKNALSEFGEITGHIELGTDVNETTLKIESFKPKEKDYNNGFSQGRKIIYLSDNRDFDYNEIDNVPKDQDRDDEVLNRKVLNPIDQKEIKGWFVNRYLFSAHKDALTKEQLENHKAAVESFSAFDPNIKFDKVESTTLDILVDTPTGKIVYEYLSSGYKSILTLLLGIIKEIEFRFPQGVTAKTFDGVICIDEIDLHLHPTWQTRIIRSLMETFPMAQFFVTTHSPHVVQSLEPDQLIALRKNGGNVEEMPVSNSPFGFRGWTIEEILTNVIGMESIDTDTFISIWEAFTTAVSHDKADAAYAAAAELKKLLHPANPLIKIIDLQLTRFADDDTTDQN